MKAGLPSSKFVLCFSRLKTSGFQQMQISGATSTGFCSVIVWSYFVVWNVRSRSVLERARSTSVIQVVHAELSALFWRFLFFLLSHIMLRQEILMERCQRIQASFWWFNSTQFNFFRQYRLRNLTICLLHSTMCGCWVFLFALTHPKIMLTDPVFYFRPWMKIILIVIIGEFLKFDSIKL
jgi:hypothetical protein